MNMSYADAPEYNSDEEGEYPYSDYESEEELDYDETTGNCEYDSQVEVSEPQSASFRYPIKFVQLAAKSSQFGTMEEMQKHHEEEEKRKQEEDAKKAWEEKVAAEDAKKAEEKKWNDIVESLPTESRATKERRMAKEAEEKRIANEKKWKEKKKQGNKPLPFAHRRNGGGKSKSHAEVDEKVLKARRAERRQARKAEKKVEEEERAVFFRKKAEKKAEEKAEEKVEEKVEVEKKVEEKKVEIEEEDADAILMRMVIAKTTSVEFKTTRNNRIAAEKKEEEERIAAEKKIEDEKKKEKQSWETVPSTRRAKKSIEPLVLKMGAASYWPVVSKPTVQPTQVSRTEAMAKLATTKEGNTKSRMCTSVASGVPCKHGSRCRFAHSVDELSPAPCFFGNECKFIGCSHRNCSFIHPCEDKLAYCKRIGVKVEKKVEKKVEVEQPKVEEKKVEEKKVEVAQPKVEEKKVENAWKRALPAPKVEVEKKVEVEQPKLEEKHIRVCRSIEMGQPCPHGHKCRFAHPTSLTPTPTPPPITRQKASLQLGDDATETETVLRVPKELAMQAMQMALQCGKSNIRIEIV